MAGTEDSRLDTRQRVLECAVAVFAEKGFRDATIHEICDKAEANIAAVNYYFGSKEKLYAEAWRKALEETMAVHPLSGGVPKDAPAVERLRGGIRALIGAFADEESKAFDIAHKEAANPTALLFDVARECIRPFQSAAHDVLHELLGPCSTAQDILFCGTSIMSQCVEVVKQTRMRRFFEKMDDKDWFIRDLDAYADHVVRFSLAGIRDMRERAEAGREETERT